MGLRVPRAQPGRQPEQSADEQRRPGAEERSGLRRRPREADRQQCDPGDERTVAASRRLRRAPRAVGHARLVERLRRQQRTRRQATDRAKRDEDAHRRDHDAANRAEHERERPHMQLEHRRPDRTDPPRSETVDDELAVQNRAGDPERAANDSQDDRFAEQQPPDDRHRVARGAEDADLAQALLDPQLEEEHGQHQRRDHQEETEVGEVLAEVGRALRRVESGRARRIEGHAHRVRRQRRPQLVAETARRARSASAPSGIGNANRGQRAVARSPQVAAAFVRDERLWRRPVVVPVALVCGANAREIDRERWIPVRQAVRAGDARIVGRQPSVGGQAGDRHDAGQRERRAARDEPGRADPRGSSRRRCRSPGAAVSSRAAQSLRTIASALEAADARLALVPAGRGRQQVQIRGRHERVRDLPIALADRVRQIGEDGNRLQAQPADGACAQRSRAPR